MERYLKNKSSAILISLFCMVLWGSAIPLIKCTYAALSIASENVGAKILVAGIRFFFAGLLGLLYAGVNREKNSVRRPVNWKYVCILSLMQTSIQYLFYYVGLSNTTGVKASIIQASNAFFVVIISAMTMRNDRLTRRRLCSLLIGTAGIVIANLNGGGGAGFRLDGEGAILVATIFNALATVYVRKYGQAQNTALVSGLQFLLGSIPLMAVGVLSAREIPAFTLPSLLMLLYGGFVSATAFTLWSMVLRYQNSGEFGVYKLFIPVFGSVFSILILKERVTLRLFVGMALVLLGSLILNLNGRRPTSDPAKMDRA